MLSIRIKMHILTEYFKNDVSKNTVLQLHCVRHQIYFEILFFEGGECCLFVISTNKTWYFMYKYCNHGVPKLVLEILNAI